MSISCISFPPHIFRFIFSKQFQTNGTILFEKKKNPSQNNIPDLVLLFSLMLSLSYHQESVYLISPNFKVIFSSPTCSIPYHFLYKKLLDQYLEKFRILVELIYLNKNSYRQIHMFKNQGLPWWLSVKESVCQAVDTSQSLGWKALLEKEMVIHMSILAWETHG